MRSLKTADVRRLVEASEPKALLCALAQITGDESLLSPEFLAPVDRTAVSLPTNGGFDEATYAKVKDRATEVLQEVLQTESEERNISDAIDVNRLLSFLTGEDPNANIDMMREQLGHEEPSLTWHKNDLAPERNFTVAIIGAGQSGLAMARSLSSFGIDYVLFERQNSVGGVWASNTYPGCRLDTNNLSYSFSHYQDSGWRDYYTQRGDLWNYYRSYADDYGIAPNIEFSKEVVEAAYSDERAEWNLVVNNVEDGTTETRTFNAIVSAVGVLNTPKMPDIAGVASFQGETMHSAEWNDAISIAGKRVAVIGTGASAFQIVPSIASEVSSLTVFQRSGPWMLPTPNYHDQLSADHRELIDLLPEYHYWLRLWDFFISTIGRYELTKVDPEWNTEGSVSALNKNFRDALERYMRGQYPDHPELADKIVPTYPVGSKRMLRDNGVWAQAMQRETTTLVTDGISHIDAQGIHTLDGEYYPVDVIIYATGFSASDFLSTIDVRAADGTLLSDFWGDDARAYKGIAIPGFANLWCLGGPNTGLVAIGCQTFMTESAVHYVGELIKWMLSENIASVDPTTQAFDEYNSWIDEGNLKMAWGAADVESWYRNRAGKVTVSWPFTLETFYEITRDVEPADWRTTPTTMKAATSG